MISVILPSVRANRLDSCLISVLEASEKEDVEVVLVTDYWIPLGSELIKKLNIKWICDEERKGVVDAINKGVAIAGGDYLFSLSDEAALSRGAFKRLKSDSKLYGDNVLLTPTHVPYFPFFYYNLPFAPFPFCHRSVIDKAGGVFIDPEYKAFYADPDLGMRAWASGVPVISCAGAFIDHPNDMSCPAHIHNVNAYLEHDRAIFRSRWDHLGEFRDP